MESEQNAPLWTEANDSISKKTIDFFRNFKIMSENRIKVRRKELPTGGGWKKIYLLIIPAVILLLGTISVITLAKFSDRLDFIFEKPLEIETAGDHQIIRVPAGGNLQTAINKANGGDVIELQAGATYKGEIRLPNKPLTDFITIQSSAAGQLPENIRVKPEQAKLMPKIVADGHGKAAVSTEKGANHFRFVGIELTTATSDYTYNLIYLAADSAKPEDVPHHFEFDRCYIHSNAQGVTRRGIALNSAQTIVKNSYFQGFAYREEETQGICGWTGTKEAKITNNYIEGGAENIMFGGADPDSPALIPDNIEIRGNYLKKPDEWKGKFTVKTLFELKNAKNVQFTDNYLENNWVGSAFRITVRNDTGKSPENTIENVLIKDNIIDGAGEGINILGLDDIHPSRVLKNLSIINNLFLKIGDEQFEGAGYFMQISNGDGILIANNTSFNKGNIAIVYGDLPKNLIVRDNIIGHGKYGINGIADIKSTAARQFFSNNVFVNSRSISDGEKIYPPNNFWAENYAAVGFTDIAQNKFNLAPNSKFKGKGADKKEIGCDAGKLNLNLLKNN